MTEAITSFTGEYRWLSNFWESWIRYAGHVWPSAEHVYQAMKTQDIAARGRIRNAPTPARAKSLGQYVELRPNWDEIKRAVMYEIVAAKFAQNEDLKAKLLATGQAELIEGNWWHDTYWGVYQGRGENHLGQILMRVRQAMQNIEARRA